MTRIRLAALVCSVLALMTLLAGCSLAGGGAVVFAVFAPSTDGMPASTVDVLDMGLPGLTNVTGSTVALEGVRLVSVSWAVHLRSVTVYGPDATDVQAQLAPGIGERRLVPESSAHVDDGGLDAAARFLGR